MLLELWSSTNCQTQWPLYPVLSFLQIRLALNVIVLDMLMPIIQFRPYS